MKQRGGSLLEFLFWITLSVSVISTLISGLTPLLQQSAFVQSRLLERQKGMHILSLFKLLTRELDWHRLPLPPKIIPGTSITFSDATPLRINKKIGSDGVISISIKGEESFIIQQRHLKKLTGCFLTDAAPRDNPEFFVGVSPDGIGSYRSNSPLSSSRCQSLELIAQPSLYFSQLAPFPETVRILYPVKREYLLYLSDQDEFRYLAVKGKNVIEHQPVESSIAGFNVTMRSLTEAPIYVFSVSVTGKSSTLIRPFSHVLGRVSPFTFLMNL